MTPARVGDWLCTYSGVAFWPLDPRSEEVNATDIAHSLSNMCRFAGHCREFYSVAQHSVLVADLVRTVRPSSHDVMAALLHDATEAYLVDVPRPIKHLLGDYRGIEDRLDRVIQKRFGITVDADLHRIIKHADNVMLATEKRDLMSPKSGEWSALPAPMDAVITPWPPATAREAFLAYLDRLTASA